MVIKRLVIERQRAVDLGQPALVQPTARFLSTVASKPEMAASGSPQAITQEAPNDLLQVLHRGVLRRLTPPLTHYTSARASRLAPHQFWQLSDIRRNPPRFIFCE